MSDIRKESLRNHIRIMSNVIDATEEFLTRLHKGKLNKEDNLSLQTKIKIFDELCKEYVEKYVKE